MLCLSVCVCVYLVCYELNCVPSAEEEEEEEEGDAPKYRIMTDSVIIRKEEKLIFV